MTSSPLLQDEPVAPEPPTLSQAEAFARIRLLRSPHIGPISYRNLIDRYGTAIAALEALPNMGGEGKRRYVAVRPDLVEREVAAVKRAGAKYLFHDQPDFPPLLAELESAPPILTYRGDWQLAARQCVAIVGARNASASAIRLARDFALGLAEAGLTVVSGLARGIDGAAHEGSLGAGSGSTIGVIASGIEIAYPPQHADLQERIASDALLIAEQPPGTEPRAQNFPSRNRIIAGLAAGTLVVEAAPKSGSLITARLAGEAGREVMAIPGSPLDARSHGCNELIRDGAILIQSVEDVLEALSGFTGEPRIRVVRAAARDRPRPVTSQPKPTAASSANPPDESDIAAMLSSAPISIDEIVRQSGASVAEVQMALLELEIAGRLERHAGGKVSRN
ncbi:DNA-protecting protein DprA [Altererythrobacter aurantiacus]|uniref:DNA-protecting protein DprA n=1 Tax=Parapontixanthobacter aurantiacus TaxID=1463599 RepID=A0A844ZCZ3_9SPHN|nr:DNA-processing protein DprA [Parapontixanthobacter aurantiacus]MXO85648.1 DNA-protecting protein DprA [Parapontixanthobacter aurantiacus]